MPRDYYDHFLKQRNNRIFTEIDCIVRQKFWRETFDIIESENWKEINEKIKRN